MKDICIIIPVHEFNEDVKALLKRAINSVPKGAEIRLSCKNGLNKELTDAFKSNKNVVIYESESQEIPSDFCTLVNQAVGGTKWFSILEYDDTYTDIWFSNFKKYADNYDDISIFLPLEDLVSFKDNKFLSFGNEPVWASSFSNEIGYIDNECLQDYFDFYMTGGIFRTSDWEELGGLKPSIKLAFWYEFLLRATANGKKIFVIPKVGYVHRLGREGSLVEEYKKNMSEKESEWWINTAKKECFFKEDRNKTYSE